jgi:hypothetical protein
VSAPGVQLHRHQGDFRRLRRRVQGWLSFFINVSGRIGSGYLKLAFGIRIGFNADQDTAGEKIICFDQKLKFTYH